MQARSLADEPTQDFGDRPRASSVASSESLAMHLYEQIGPMKSERLRWLAYLEREGPSEWYEPIVGAACIDCGFLGWTRLHRKANGLPRLGESLGVYYELSRQGRAVLQAYREGQRMPWLAPRGRQ